MSNIPIFLPADNNYAPYLGVTMASILSNTKSYINFYILDGGIKNHNKEKISSLKTQFNNFSIEFLNINVEKEFNGFVLPEEQRFNKSTYMRLLIPKIKPSLEKVLYLDTDIVVLDDISNLYEQSIENYALGAVWDESRKSYNSDTKVPMELSKDYKYFNAGVLLIDIQKWIQDDIVKALFDIEIKYRDKIPHADESILNKYFDCNYKTLCLKYNVMDWDLAKNTLDDICVRHYATSRKPWMLNPEIVTKSLYENLDDFWKYAKITPFYQELIQSVSNIEEQEKIKRLIQIKKICNRARA